MISVRHQPHLTRRATAWFLLLLCAWMGSGGVLHHTDEGGFAFAGSHSRAGLHHLTSLTPLDTCAACEWTEGLQGKTLAIYHVQSPLFLLRPRLVALASSPIRRVLRLRSPRAPPFSVICI